MMIVLVLAIVVGVLTVQAIVWTATLRRWRAATATRVATLKAEVESSGERLRCGPTVGIVRRRHSSMTRVALALTEVRVFMFAPSRSEIPLTNVQAVRASNSFNTEARAGFRWLVFETTDGEVGLAVPTEDHERWFDAAVTLVPAHPVGEALPAGDG